MSFELRSFDCDALLRFAMTDSLSDLDLHHLPTTFFLLLIHISFLRLSESLVMFKTDWTIGKSKIKTEYAESKLPTKPSASILAFLVF